MMGELRRETTKQDRRGDICHVVIINGKDLIAYLQPQYVFFFILFVVVLGCARSRSLVHIFRDDECSCLFLFSPHRRRRRIWLVGLSISINGSIK